ncbi:hypothetical protein [Streptacidiphilus sp. EB103A]|uniref:hypothetical protein n=1 Tax=Streptacidiphilus sp. EB103A TaxID=3156275 RepID=UPI00351375C7
MQALKYTPEVVYIVEHRDLEAFIAERYGLPYDLTADLESVNGSEHLVRAHVSHRAWDRPYEDDGAQLVEQPGPEPSWSRRVAAWAAGQGAAPPVRMLLSDLAWRGVLPHGAYLVTVSW